MYIAKYEIVLLEVRDPLIQWIRMQLVAFQQHNFADVIRSQ